MAGVPAVTGEYRYGFNDGDVSVSKFVRGLIRHTVEGLSRIKKEPKWMHDFRLLSVNVLWKKPVPTWGADLSRLNFDDIVYYVKPAENQGRTRE
jgi:Fe-S cluster assembly protein SufB